MVDSGFCSVHKRIHGKSTPIYDTARWREYRAQYIAGHPWCVDPFSRHQGRQMPAQCVGHRVAHRGDQALFWSPANHWPLCQSCNAYQGVTFEGGFGRARKALETKVEGRGGPNPYGF
jgi:5-methylcytosine-specific restriction endonuclease McrA